MAESVYVHIKTEPLDISEIQYYELHKEDLILSMKNLETLQLSLGGVSRIHGPGAELVVSLKTHS